MRHPFRFATTGLLLLVSVPALVSASGCVNSDPSDSDEEDVGASEDALLGQVFVDNTCTAPERAFLLDSAKRGRAIAQSSAFETCIRSVMAGATSLPGDPHLGRITTDVEGPYDYCSGDPAPADPIGTVVGLARSNLGVAIGCQPTGQPGESAHATLTTNPGPNETLTYIQASLDSSIAAQDQNYVANSIWHEAMHQHGYGHGNSGLAEDCGYLPGQFSDDDTAWMRRHTVPYMVGACMGYLGDISDACRASLSCKPDEVPIRSAMDPNSSCVCGHDPGWHMLPPYMFNQVAVARDNAGDLEVVGIAPPGSSLFVSAQSAPNGTTFNAWTAIPSSGFVWVDVNKNQDQRLEAFAVSSSGTLYHVWQNASRVWGGLVSLGRNDVRQVAVTNQADGSLNAFVLTTAGSVFRTVQNGPNGGWSGAWEALGGTGLTSIKVGNNADGRPEVFAVGGNKMLYHQWQWGGTTTWSGWSPLGRNDVDQVAVVQESNGALAAYVRAAGSIYVTAQNGANMGWSGAWTPLFGTGLRDLTVARGSDGHVKVFVVGGDYQAYADVESSPLSFNGWGLVPGGVQYVQVASGIDQAGRTNLIGLQTDGNVSHVAVP